MTFTGEIHRMGWDDLWHSMLVSRCWTDLLANFTLPISTPKFECMKVCINRESVQVWKYASTVRVCKCESMQLWNVWKKHANSTPCQTSVDSPGHSTSAAPSIKFEESKDSLSVREPPHILSSSSSSPISSGNTDDIWKWKGAKKAYLVVLHRGVLEIMMSMGLKYVWNPLKCLLVDIWGSIWLSVTHQLSLGASISRYHLTHGWI